MLRWEDYLGLSSELNEITRVLTSERGRRACVREKETMQAEVGVMHTEDGGRGHEPRNGR